MKQFSNDFLSTLKTLPNSCVYALISDSNMKAIVSHSNTLQSRIGALIEYFGYDDARLLILQKIEDNEGKLLLCEMYKKKYSTEGYKIVNVRPYINYRVSFQYSPNLQWVYVVLYNSRRDKTIVGQFKSMDDARSFVSACYINKEVVCPVFAIGSEKYIN
jgi:hypothetical protein